MLNSQFVIQDEMLYDTKKGTSYDTFYQHPTMQTLAKKIDPVAPYRVTTIYYNKITEKSLAWHPAYAWAYGFETVDGYLNLYPERYQAFWAQVIAPLETLDTPNYLHFTDWGNRIYLFAPGSAKSVLPSPPNNTLSPSRYYDQELLALANVRYIISPFHLVDTPWTELIPATEDTTYLPIAIYENSQVFPRFFVTHRLQHFEDTEALLQAMGDASIQELRSTVYVAQEDLPNNTLVDTLTQTDIPTHTHQNQVDIQTYTADRIVLDVETDAPGILVATNKYYPYWKAYIDGAETDIFPAYHAFQGIYLPEGTHQVILHYEPPWSKLPFL